MVHIIWYISYGTYDTVHMIWTISYRLISYHKDFAERFFMERFPFALVLHKEWCHTIEYTSDALKNLIHI